MSKNKNKVENAYKAPEAKVPEQTENSPRPTDTERFKRNIRAAAGGAGQGGKLRYTGTLDPAFSYRICNDQGSNIQEMKSLGFDICVGDEVQFLSSNEIKTGSQHSVVVDRGTGAQGILMKRPIELDEFSKKVANEKIAETEKTMFRKLETEEGRYGTVENTNSLAKQLDN